MVISSMPKPTGENRPPSGGGIPIRKERYLHRFDRSQTALLVVRTIASPATDLADLSGSTTFVSIRFYRVARVQLDCRLHRVRVGVKGSRVTPMHGR